MTSRFALAKERIVSDLENVIADIFGAHAKRKDKNNSGWNVSNPWRAGSKPKQMIIWLRGARRGGWTDFVSGDKGDAIDLVAYVHEGIVHSDSRIRAVEWAEDRYGLKSLAPETRAAMAATAKASQERLEAEENDRRQNNRERARKMFYAADAKILDTPVEVYLRSRGIELNEVPNLTRSFRYREKCEYWLGSQRDGEGRKIGRSPVYPAMVSAMVSANGTLNACHMTFLSPDGRSKAPVEKAKLMWPEVASFVVRVTNGPSGMTAEDAAAAGISGLASITEGIEDSFSIAIATPELRCWAAGSLSGLLYVPDHPSVSGWIIFKDNDWGKPQAAALFNRAVARFRSFGKPVEVVAMPADWGKDVNDALNQENDNGQDGHS
ncbi:hypothetical protein LJR231_002253 [Phyllobacterium sp. LjRoot231]|uniref:DUF7146 domain-containing protein n=1 Tax=Phyllobacterium sp. LjRoot231 TaxID=3342289 RepID=UPI003ECEF29F